MSVDAELEPDLLVLTADFAQATTQMIDAANRLADAGLDPRVRDRLRYLAAVNTIEAHRLLKHMSGPLALEESVLEMLDNL